jgi:hypothetical protein
MSLQVKIKVEAPVSVIGAIVGAKGRVFNPTFVVSF